MLTLRTSCIAGLLLCAASGWAQTPGTIVTIAGDGTKGYSGDGGLATSAELNFPQRVAVDNAGNLYISDTLNSVVRKVNPAGTITTVAGNGTLGYSGDGGPATSAELFDPEGIAVDTAGNLYIGDVGNARVRKVNSAGTITTVAGNGTTGYTGDGGSATSAELAGPEGVAVDTAGNFYIADAFKSVIRKVTVATGIITTVAGNGTAGYSGDGGAATSAKLNEPYGLGLDSAGDIYIADSDNNVVREVVVATGVISTVAGNGTFGYSGDGGTAIHAELATPFGVAVDSSGNLYIADDSNSVVRKVTVATSVITTVAGDGSAGYSGDGGPATSAKLYDCVGIGVDSAGNLYIPDFGNQRVRKVIGAIANDGVLSTQIQSNGTLIAYYLDTSANVDGILYPWSQWGRVTGTGSLGGAPAISPGSSLVTDVNGLTGEPEAFYLTSVAGAQHIEHLFSVYGPIDLNALAASSQAAATGSGIYAYNDACVGNYDVFYIGSDHLIHLIYWSSSLGFQSDTSISAARVAVQGSALNGHGKEVFYLGTDNHVHEIWGWTGCSGVPPFDGWHANDITTANGNDATNAEANSPLGGFRDSNGNDFVFYIDASQDLHELFFGSTATWTNLNLTTTFAVPKPATGSAITAHQNTLGTSSDEVFFSDSSGNVQLVSAPSSMPNQWVSIGALNSKAAACPETNTAPVVAAAGSPLATDLNTNNNSDEIYYVGGNQHIYDLYNKSGWQCTDVTVHSGAPGATP